MTPGNDSEAAELADRLWRVREVLERALFKTVELRLVVAGEQSRWLARADNELTEALAELRRAEVLRAASSDAFAARLGLPAGATLPRLCAAAPEPWSSILRDHLVALRELLADFEAAADESRRSLEDAAPPSNAARLSYEGAVRTAGQVRQLSLDEFLAG